MPGDEVLAISLVLKRLAIGLADQVRDPSLRKTDTSSEICSQTPLKLLGRRLKVLIGRRLLPGFELVTVCVWRHFRFEKGWSRWVDALHGLRLTANPSESRGPGSPWQRVGLVRYTHLRYTDSCSILSTCLRFDERLTCSVPQDGVTIDTRVLKVDTRLSIGADDDLKLEKISKPINRG